MLPQGLAKSSASAQRGRGAHTRAGGHVLFGCKAQIIAFQPVMQSSCGPNTIRLTVERGPSAPTTRWNVSRHRAPEPASSGRTRAPPTPWVISTGWWRTAPRPDPTPLPAMLCHGAASMSPRNTAAGPDWSRNPGSGFGLPRRSSAQVFPPSFHAGPRMCGWSAMPRSAAACRPSGNRKTKWPPVRGSAARSMTTGGHPTRRSSIAADTPAIPRPTTNARFCVTWFPSSCSNRLVR